MAAKTSLDLKTEIWDTGKCSGCGACVAVCPGDSLTFSEGTMVISPKSSGYCKQDSDGVACGACYAACPRTGEQPAETIGKYLELHAAKAEMEIPRRQSGGAVTAILANALDEGLIDAVVTVTEDRWTMKPSSVVITKSDVLVEQAGSRYSWWVPLLAALKTAVIKRKYKKIAIVGVPCVVQAISRIRSSDHDLLIPYAKAIRLVVGLFCTETFDYDALVEKKLKSEHHIATWEIKKLDVRGKLVITMNDGNVFSFPMKELDDAVRAGCHFCTDATSLFSDISAGSVGSPEGYTTLIVRDPVGKFFVDNAVTAGILETGGDIDKEAIEKLASNKIKKNSIA